MATSDAELITISSTVGSSKYGCSGQAAGLGPLYERLYLLIRDYNYVRRWRGHSYRSIDVEGYVYWIRTAR